MTNYLVTGGAGFIGSHLVDQLLNEPETTVTAVDSFDDFYNPSLKRKNLASHLSDSRFRLLEADIRDAEALKQLQGQEFEAIIHLAARAGVRPSLENARLYQDVNVGGTLNLLELARSARVRKFIFGSSSSVYGPLAPTPFRENAPLSPISPYAATKAAGELLTYTYSSLYGIQGICLRFFTVFGPRQRPDLAIHKFTDRIWRGKPIPVFGDGSTERDYTYVDDIVAGIMAALSYDASQYEIINLGGSNAVRLDRLIGLIEARLGRTAIIERHPAQPGDLEKTLADTTKAAQLLGFQSRVGIEQGLDRFVEWYRNETF
jgi:UDP-glucuronate 4-epimerase